MLGLARARVEDARARPFSGEIPQRQRGDHENNRHAGREAREKIARSAAAEDGRARAAEDGAHVRAFAGLEQHDQDKADADEDVNDGHYGNHDPAAGSV